MAKVTFALLCGKVIEDKATSLATIVDQINGVALSYFPAPLGWITIVSNWEREGDSERDLRVRAVPAAPNGERREEQAVETVLTSKKPFHRWRTQAAAWIVDAPGRWEIQLEQFRDETWQLAASIPLIVDKAEPESVVSDSGEPDPSRLGV